MNLDEVLRKGFEHTGSLTKFINEHCGDNALVIKNATFTEDENYIERRVTECVGDTKIIEAKVIIQKAKCKADFLQKVRSLGNLPIGPLLFAEKNIQRDIITSSFPVRKSVIKSDAFELEVIEDFIYFAI